jgi:hypothetical protein
VLSFRHSPLVKVASVEKTTVFHIPTQGKGSVQTRAKAKRSLSGSLYLLWQSQEHRTSHPGHRQAERPRQSAPPTRSVLTARRQAGSRFKSAVSDKTREFGSVLKRVKHDKYQ